MKLPFVLLLMLSFLSLYSCGIDNSKPIKNSKEVTDKEPGIEEPIIQLVESDTFQLILDSANVKGAILIFNPKDNAYYSNDFDYAEEGCLPASTFKITNSIIALETGVVQNDTTLFAWDGKERRLKAWEQDLTFREAFHVSCVPCYQEIARKIGPKRMEKYLTAFNYGKMEVDSTNIDVFWLEGDSEINQYQQIAFLQKFYNSELQISKRTKNIMQKMMVIDENEDHKISGKTGWSIREGNNKGWFVGYLETKEQVYYFATRLEPKEGFDMNQFPEIRKKITHQALQQLGFMQ